MPSRLSAGAAYVAASPIRKNMRAETLAKVDEIKQGVALLRRHL
jgi:hypothetical protein